VIARLPGAKTGFEPEVLDYKKMSFSGNEEDALFINDGAGHFVDCSFQARVDLRGDGRSAAWADFDGDGDLDLVVRQFQSPKVVLLRNDLAAGPATHWLQVKLRGTKSNRMGVGALVRACVGERCQVRLIQAGNGFLSQAPAVAHFGLGKGTSATVTVEWPSGLVQDVGAVAADEQILVTEEHDGMEPVSVPKISLGKPLPSTLDLAHLIEAGAKGAEQAALLEAQHAGKPVLINLWAPWCKPCRDEAPVLADYAKRCGAGSSRVGLSMEPDVASSKKGIAKLGMNWTLSVATPEQNNLIGHAIEQTPLPSTLAFDADGHLTGAIIGKVTAQSLERLVPCPSSEKTETSMPKPSEP
jgi:thiol-disulfide isomerase/thioredoxin